MEPQIKLIKLIKLIDLIIDSPDYAIEPNKEIGNAVRFSIEYDFSCPDVIE